MKIRKTLFAIAIASMAIPAVASIQYTFAGLNNENGLGTNAIGFTLVVPSFLLVNEDFSPLKLASCTDALSACADVQFFDVNNGRAPESILFQGQLVYSFGNGSVMNFSTLGTFTTNGGSSLHYGQGVLTVSEVSSVPEPSALAMLIAGIVAVGVSAHRRQRAHSAA